MSEKQLNILERALAREKAARKQAEKILEEKSAELYNLNRKLEESHAELITLYSKTNSQLQGVFENIVDAYVIMDLWGNILKMNEAAVSLLGFDNVKDEGNLMELVAKEDINNVAPAFKQLLDEGSITDFTIQIVTKKGTRKLVHINASIIYENEEIVGAQGIVRDITEAKQNAELIEEQKKELDVIVDNSSLGIVLTQFGQIIRTNEAFQELLGYSEAELSKLTIKDLSFIEDFPESKKYLEQINAGAIDNFVVNKRYRKKDGSVIWAKTNVNAVRDSEGNIKFQVALVEDVTSHRERALILDMINNLTKSILGKTDINEIAWEIVNKIAKYLDSEDCVIYLVDHENYTLEQIAVYGNKLDHENQIINKMIIPIGEGIVGDVVKTHKSEIIKDTSKDERYVVDNERRYSEITVPIISNGKVIGVIDSEHKDKNYYTKEHVKTIESIASLVAIQLRTALNIRERQKAEARNVHLLKELEKSNDELQEYAHIVSHDLKSPLRSIDALVNWIKEDNKGSFDEITERNFDLIETTLEKMEQLISDILMYSSIGSERSEEETVDLNQLVTDLKQILYVPEHIEITILNPLPQLKGDKTKLQQLFQNLISNAVKFNDKEKGLIEIDVTEQKSYYQFSIKDNGVGIDKKHHEKIFKIFHALSDNKESTGIGLSIVKKIIDMHKGEIWIESELGKGTTFHFTLKK